MAYSLRQRLVEWKRAEPEPELELDDSTTIDQFDPLEAWLADAANIELVCRTLIVLDSASRFAASRGESRSLQGLITAYFKEASQARSTSTGLEIARWYQAQAGNTKMDDTDVDSLAEILIDTAEDLGLVIESPPVCLICRPPQPKAPDAESNAGPSAETGPA